MLFFFKSLAWLLRLGKEGFCEAQGCVQISTTRTGAPLPEPTAQKKKTKRETEAPSPDAWGLARLGLGAERGLHLCSPHPILGEGRNGSSGPFCGSAAWILEGLEALRPPGSGGQERQEGLYRDRAFWRH